MAFHRVQRNVTINPCLRSLALAGYLHLSCFTGRFGPRVGLSLSLGKDKEKNMDIIKMVGIMTQLDSYSTQLLIRDAETIKLMSEMYKKEKENQTA